MTPHAAFMTVLLSLPPCYCHWVILCEGGQKGSGVEKMCGGGQREGGVTERERGRGREGEWGGGGEREGGSL